MNLQEGAGAASTSQMYWTLHPLDMEHLLWLVLGDSTWVPKKVSGFWRPWSWLMIDFLLLSIFPQQMMKSLIPGPPVKVLLGEPISSLAFSVVSNFLNPLQLTGLWSDRCAVSAILPQRESPPLQNLILSEVLLVAEGCWKPGLGLRQSGPWLPAFLLWVRKGVQDKP